MKAHGAVWKTRARHQDPDYIGGRGDPDCRLEGRSELLCADPPSLLHCDGQFSDHDLVAGAQGAPFFGGFDYRVGRFPLFGGDRGECGWLDGGFADEVGDEVSAVDGGAGR